MSVYNDPIYDRLYDGRSIQENYYVEPQKNERGRVVSKEEKQKKLELYQNKHTYIITADHPAYETLSSVTVTPMIEETIVVDPSKTESGYDSYLIPHRDPSTPETATRCPNGKEEINMPIQQNGKHTLQREESQFIDKVNVDVSVKNIYDLNKDQIPEGTQVAVISPIPEGQLPGVMKQAITKQITTTENGTQTYSCPATQYWDKVTVNTNVPQSVILDPNEVPEGWHVIVIPPDPEQEGEIEPEAKVKMYEHKEVTITENGTTTVTATNEDMQVLKDVKVTVQVPQTVTAAEAPTGYDIIQVPTYDPETGKWDPEAEGQRLQMYRTEKTLDVIENGEYTVNPASNELITKVNVNVNVEAQTMNIMNDNGTVEGHDTFIVDKEEGHESDDPIIYSTVKFVEPEITCTQNKDYTIESIISTDQECHLIKKAKIHVQVAAGGNFEEKTANITEQNQEITPSEGYDAMSKVTIQNIEPYLFTENYKFYPYVYNPFYSNAPNNSPQGTISFKYNAEYPNGSYINKSSTPDKSVVAYLNNIWQFYEPTGPGLKPSFNQIVMTTKKFTTTPDNNRIIFYDYTKSLFGKTAGSAIKNFLAGVILDGYYRVWLLHYKQGKPAQIYDDHESTRYEYHFMLLENGEEINRFDFRGRIARKIGFAYRSDSSSFAYIDESEMIDAANIYGSSMIPTSASVITKAKKSDSSSTDEHLINLTFSQNYSTNIDIAPTPKYQLQDYFYQSGEAMTYDVYELAKSSFPIYDE